MKPTNNEDSGKAHPLKPCASLKKQNPNHTTRHINQEENQVYEMLEPLETTFWWKKVSMFLLAAAANRPVRRIRCVGFGSVATSKTTQSHLNVAIMIAKCLRCLKVTVCDPAMQDSDMNLIRQHGFVIESDATVKRDLDEAGVDVLFMPFCDVTLYVLVLQTYIENGLAGNVVLFGKYFIRLANVGGCYGEAIKVMLRNRVVRQYCLPPILRQPSYEPLDGLCISILEQPSGKVYDACVAEFKKIKEKEKPLE